MSMKNLVSKIVRAPTANPCREQIAWASWSMNTSMVTMTMLLMMMAMMKMMLATLAMLTCGMISPKTTIPRVAPMTATRPPPPVSASSRIVNVLFTFKVVGEPCGGCLGGWQEQEGGDYEHLGNSILYYIFIIIIARDYQDVAKQDRAEKKVAHCSDRHYCLDYM